MRALVLFLSAVLLCCGCKRHAPASQKEAINGAFGWALAARLPAAFEVQTNGASLRYVDPRGKIPPFEMVVLDMTADRTIFAITGMLTRGAPEAFDAVGQSLSEALGKKYELKKKTEDAKAGIGTVQFGDAAREVILARTLQPRTLALCYRDIALSRKAAAGPVALNTETTAAAPRQ